MSLEPPEDSQLEPGRGEYRKGTRRRNQKAYVIRKTAGWYIEDWIPPALRELAQEYSVDSPSDIVNDALKAVCYLHGKQAGSQAADPYRTARWRYFSDRELHEIVDALGEKMTRLEKPGEVLREVWMSAKQAMEPQAGSANWQKSVLNKNNR